MTWKTNLGFCSGIWKIETSKSFQTFLFLSQVVRQLPAGCQATAYTVEPWASKTLSTLDGSFVFQMSTVPSKDPTHTYSESGLNTALKTMRERHLKSLFQWFALFQWGAVYWCIRNKISISSVIVMRVSLKKLACISEVLNHFTWSNHILFWN